MLIDHCNIDPRSSSIIQMIARVMMLMAKHRMKPGTIDPWLIITLLKIYLVRT
jgi:hypothetical protein